MSQYDGDWAPYMPVAERRRQATLTVAKLRKRGLAVAPVTLEGRSIAATFWGRAWCNMMESYSDYSSRLPRGRSYVRNGFVIDLKIDRGRVTALVSGSEVYNVTITIKETTKPRWQAICADCSGSIDSVIELLQGRLSKGVMERICRQRTGLFPEPSEIRFVCTCPDHASMCKHVAAVFYGVGARLDRKPELLFLLRAVDAAELVAGIDDALPLSKSRPKASKVLVADDMAALFGLDLAEAEPPDQPLDKPGRPKEGLGKDKATTTAPKRSTSAAQAAPKGAVVAGEVVATVAAVKTMKARHHQILVKPSKQKLQPLPGTKPHGQLDASKIIQTKRPPAKRMSGPTVTRKKAMG
jgi:uncharacterized Zn finger protein